MTPTLDWPQLKIGISFLCIFDQQTLYHLLNLNSRHSCLNVEHVVHCIVMDFLNSALEHLVFNGFSAISNVIIIIISVVKDKKGDLSDKDNYRPIAITCVASKILELLIISKYGEFFATRCNQFGFKKKHSTDMAVFALKEVINYYNSLSSPVYACMLDSSKAFDRVNHYHLFDKLLKRGVPKLLVRLLFFWYKSQTFSVVLAHLV